MPVIAECAKNLAPNPLGIIALFIVLVYGFASLMVGFSGKLTANERAPVIWFLVVFPVLVLFMFSWLVSHHHAKLYSPADFRQDASFIEASRQQVEVAAAIGAATARKMSSAAPMEIVSDTRVGASRLAKLMTPQTLCSVRLRKILWVDDQPEDKPFEVEALQSLGFKVDFAASTQEALDKLQRSAFDLIISDMNRPGEVRAGFSLLTRLRLEGDTTPYVLYSAPATPECQAEAWKRGAVGVTESPQDLVTMVLETVSSRKESQAA